MDRQAVIAYAAPIKGNPRHCLTGETPLPDGVSRTLPPDSPLLRRLAGAAARKTDPSAGQARAWIAGGEGGNRERPGIRELEEPLRRTGVRVRTNGITDATASRIASEAERIRTERRAARETPATAGTTSRRRRRGSGGAADALPWETATRIISDLERKADWTGAMLMACGCYTGLRISDLLGLKWKDLTGPETLAVTERKTGKKRLLRINRKLREIAMRCAAETGPDPEDHILYGWTKGPSEPMSRQGAAKRLKKIQREEGIDPGLRFSAHSLRKTFGRRVWERESARGDGEKALLLLCDVFGHSSVAITKRYLGIRTEEILSVYNALDE